MAVTDLQAAMLHAYLTGDSATHGQLRSQPAPADGGAGYGALFGAAFCVAVERRFAPNDSPAAIMEFVADVRSRSDSLASKIDPTAAERLIRAVYIDEQLGDLDRETRLLTQYLLLGALVADEHLDDSGLDEFIGEARKLADQWLSRPG
jgi:hypothetical protein